MAVMSACVHVSNAGLQTTASAVTPAYFCECLFMLQHPSQFVCELLLKNLEPV